MKCLNNGCYENTEKGQQLCEKCEIENQAKIAKIKQIRFEKNRKLN